MARAELANIHLKIKAVPEGAHSYQVDGRTLVGSISVDIVAPPFLQLRIIIDFVHAITANTLKR